MLNKATRYLVSLFILLQLISCAVSQDTSSIDSEKTFKSKTYTEAVTAMKTGDLDDAQKLFRGVIKEHPNHDNAHVNMGIIFIKKDALGEAENAFNRALAINPKNIFALNQLGFIYRKQGLFAKSKMTYVKAININESFAFAHLNLGILYDLYLYDLEAAIEQYKIYNQLTKEKNPLVAKWIFDLERRYSKSLSKN